MWWYNQIFMPLGLRFQKKLRLAPGMIATGGSMRFCSCAEGTRSPLAENQVLPPFRKMICTVT